MNTFNLRFRPLGIYHALFTLFNDLAEVNISASNSSKFTLPVILAIFLDWLGSSHGFPSFSHFGRRLDGINSAEDSKQNKQAENDSGGLHWSNKIFFIIVWERFDEFIMGSANRILRFFKVVNRQPKKLRQSLFYTFSELRDLVVIMICFEVFSKCWLGGALKASNWKITDGYLKVEN